MKRMIYTKLDETTKANDRKMEKMNDEIKGEITKVSSKIELVEERMNAQFAKITDLIQQ